MQRVSGEGVAGLGFLALTVLAGGCENHGRPPRLVAPHLFRAGGAELDERARADERLLLSYYAGAQGLLKQLAKEEALWQRDAQTPLDPDQRRRSLSLFEQVLSHVVALDALSSFHGNFWQLDILTDWRRHARHFQLAAAAYFAQLRLGLAFVDRTLNKRQFEKLLDEGDVATGLPPGLYAKLKMRVVHVNAVTRALALHQYHKLLGRTLYPKLKDDPARPSIVPILDESYRATKGRLLGRGAKLFGGNALDIVKDSAHLVWFPVQARVAEVMGDTKVHRLSRMLINLEQVAAAAAKSRPGDILVQRRNCLWQRRSTTGIRLVPRRAREGREGSLWRPGELSRLPPALQVGHRPALSRTGRYPSKSVRLRDAGDTIWQPLGARLLAAGSHLRLASQGDVRLGRSSMGSARQTGPPLPILAKIPLLD